jgi:APA family basic amino acid/polyamine antiporter
MHQPQRRRRFSLKIDSDRGATHRTLGLGSTTLLIVGNIIGSAIFVLPSSLAPFGWNALSAWGVTLAGALCLASIYADLATHAPDRGTHATLRETLGPNAAFVGSFGYLVSIWAANAAIAVAGTSYFLRLLPAASTSPSTPILVALSAVGALTLANWRGWTQGVQGVSTLIKVIPFLLVIALAVSMLASDAQAAVAPMADTPISASATLGCVAITLFAMQGLESAALPRGRIRDAVRTVPRATMLGTLLAGLLTLLATVSVALMMPTDAIVQSATPISDFIERALGHDIGTWVTLAGVISCFGCLNGWLYLGTELPASMGATRDLPASLSKRDHRGVATNALWLCSAVTSILLLMALSRTAVAAFEFAALIATATALVFYGFCLAAFFRLLNEGRITPTASRICRLLGAALFTLFALASAGSESILYGIGFIAMGWIWRRFQRA